MGMRGSGKTTIGRALAAHTHTAFIDLDDRALQHLRAASVTNAWKLHGEQGWRDAEAIALSQALAQPPSVIALGGGTVTHPPARESIIAAQNSRQASVIYLQCNQSELVRRLDAQPGDRPPITPHTSAGLTSEVESLLVQRTPIYQSLADVTLDVSTLSVQDAVAHLIPHIHALKTAARATKHGPMTDP